MNKLSSRTVTFAAMWVTLLGSSALHAVESAAPVDLMRHAATNTADICQVGPAEYEWSLPDGLLQSIDIDLNALGIDASDYDEFRFELKPEGSRVFLQAIVKGVPTEDEVTSWYSKFRMPIGEWREGRFDMRLDDDGIYISKQFQEVPANHLVLKLTKLMFGVPGEPSWRKARLRRPRFIRYPVAASFRLAECEMETAGAQVSYTYPLHLTNRLDKPCTVLIEPDSDQSLKYFRVEAERQIELAAGASVEFPIRLVISRTVAMTLPPLYAEPLIPRISVQGIPDSDVIPIMGYRRWPMWGVVPIFTRKTWTPPTLQAFVAAREQVLPKIADWRKNTVAHADEILPYDWTLPINRLPAHDSGYHCQDPTCKARLRPTEPMSLHQHVCTKCGTIYENVESIDSAYLSVYYGNRARAIRACALSWLLTGEEKYAEKASTLLLSWAQAYPDMPIFNDRSTSGATKLGVNSLLTSYILNDLAQGYAFLAAWPRLGGAKRAAIDSMLKDEALRVARHCVEYTNQTAEHVRAYGATAIATGFWPLAGEAIYGDFGWHQLVEFGFSEDGITHEAGAYHRAIFGAMDDLAAFALGQGVNLFTERFKRVYDGSLIVGILAAPYEAAYAVYGSPAYLSVLQQRRAQGIGEQAVLHGVLGLADVSELPVTSTHMPGDGYLFLCRGNAGDSYEVRLSYNKHFDRTEFDRFSTFFLRNGRPVETMPGRMGYGAFNGAFMFATAAHNAVVIDGEDQQAVQGRLIAYEPDTETPLAVIETDPEAPLYEGVQQLRAIALIENNTIVFDALRCDRPRTIDRYQYGRGEASFSCEMQPMGEDFPFLPQPVNELPPIGDISTGVCGKQCIVKYPDDFTMTLVSENDMELCRGLTHGGYNGQPMEVTFARVVDASQASFLAAFTWGKDPAPPTLEIVKNTPDEIRLRVAIGAREYVIEIEPLQKTARVIKP